MKQVHKIRAVNCVVLPVVLNFCGSLNFRDGPFFTKVFFAIGQDCFFLLGVHFSIKIQVKIMQV